MALGCLSEAQEAEFQRRVLARLQQALAHTEREFFRFVKAEMEDRPDLAMVGSCVLLLLIHGPYLFSINLGDSRALLATAKLPASQPPASLASPLVSTQAASMARAGRGVVPLSLQSMALDGRESQGEEEGENGSDTNSPPVLRVGLGMHPKSIKSSSGDLTLLQHQGCLQSPTSVSRHWSPQYVEQQLQLARSRQQQQQQRRRQNPGRQLSAIQLSEVHCCDNDVERQRVIAEHQEDATPAVSGDRVKGKLRVTRAFGAGYLKSAKLNDGLMGIFRVRELDSPPYISSTPFAHARRLGPMDRFAVAGSDGLFDFFTNEEVVDEVAAYLEEHPMGDPAKHMLELLLERAARQAGEHGGNPGWSYAWLFGHMDGLLSSVFGRYGPYPLFLLYLKIADAGVLLWLCYIRLDVEHLVELGNDCSSLCCAVCVRWMQAFLWRSCEASPAVEGASITMMLPLWSSFLDPSTARRKHLQSLELGEFWEAMQLVT